MGYYHELKLIKLMEECPMNSTHEIPKGCRGCMYYQGDRKILAEKLNISPHQLSYVTHSGEGEGLLFFGNVILPFVDRFPANTELYKIMTTKLSEVQAAKEEANGK